MLGLLFECGRGGGCQLLLISAHEQKTLVSLPSQLTLHFTYILILLQNTLNKDQYLLILVLISL